jgi:hypothetical protein
MRVRPRAVPPPRQFDTGREHSRCYASPLGGCSEQLTAEHYLGHALLKNMTADGGQLRVSKFPWTQQGESRAVSPAKMTARVLCENHNNVLEGYDRVGARFVDMLLKTGNPGDETCRHAGLFNGEDLERWLLKMLCGVKAMESLNAGTAWKAPVEWLNVLFKLGPPRSLFGLWLNLGPVIMFPNSRPSMSATPMDDPDGGPPLGLRVHFSGLEFVFMVGDKGRSLYANSGRFRPGMLTFRSKGYCSVRIGIFYDYAPLGLHIRIEHPDNERGKGVTPDQQS